MDHKGTTWRHPKYEVKGEVENAWCFMELLGVSFSPDVFSQWQGTADAAGVWLSCYFCCKNDCKVCSIELVWWNAGTVKPDWSRPVLCSFCWSKTCTACLCDVSKTHKADISFCPSSPENNDHCGRAYLLSISFFYLIFFCALLLPMDQTTLLYPASEQPWRQWVDLLQTYTARIDIKIWHILFVNTSFHCPPSWVASEPGKWEALFLMSHWNSSVVEVANNSCFQYRKQYTLQLFLF